MKSAADRSVIRWSNTRHLLFLSCFVIGGLALGVTLARSIWASQWVISYILTPVTFVGCIGVALFPFLISLVAICFLRPWAVYTVCFLKSLSFGFISFVVNCAFSSNGWLVRLLLLFTDSVSYFLLCLLWVHTYDTGRVSLRNKSLFYLFATVLLAFVDSGYISPFLASILF